MMRVLLGGLGRERAGSVERSSVRDGLDLEDDVVEVELDRESWMLAWALALASADAILLLGFASESSRSFFDAK